MLGQMCQKLGPTTVPSQMLAGAAELIPSVMASTIPIIRSSPASSLVARCLIGAQVFFPIRKADSLRGEKRRPTLVLPYRDRQRRRAGGPRSARPGRWAPFGWGACDALLVTHDGTVIRFGVVAAMLVL